MKVEIQANELAGILAKVRGCMAGESTIPILACFLIEADAGIVRATTTQGDLQATASVACDVIEAGSIALPGSAFAVIKSLGKTKITMHTPAEDRVAVEGSRQRYEFATLPPADFAHMQAEDAASQFFVSASLLRAGIAAVMPGIPDDQKLDYRLNGVCVAYEPGNRLAFVTTDKHRFLHYAIEAPAGSESAPRITIPQKACAQICNLLSGFAGDASVSISPTHVVVDTGDASISSRLIAGDFIAYDRLVAAVGGRGFRVTASELDEAVSRLIAMRTDAKLPALQIATNGTTAEIYSDRRARDAGFEVVDADIDEPTDFHVSVKYFSALVGMWPDSAELDIALTPLPYGNGKGLMIAIQSASVPAMKQIIMPMAGPKRDAAP